MKKHIPYGKQSISNDDINAVVDVLKSDFLTQGPSVGLFEKDIASYCNVKYAVASNSATSALHLSCMALGIVEGDIVWTASNTFAASSNCVLYCGATVDFIDINPDTYNICTQKLEEKLELAKKNNSLPKLVIPVHMCGQSCDMKRIFELSKIYNFKIIEDGSHAIGGSYRGSKIGSCQYSDIVVLSFHPVKIITTGEGGICLTNDKALSDRISLLRSHGITRDESLMESNPDGPWYYEQIALGFNYRMTDIHAALGSSQLKRIDSFISKRHYIASKYNDALSCLPIQIPYQPKYSYSSYHLYVIRLNLNKVKTNHRDFFIKLKEAGIGVNIHYIPVYLHPYYKKLGFKKGYCIEAENYYESAISIPIHPSLSDSDQAYIINEIKKYFEK